MKQLPNILTIFRIICIPLIIICFNISDSAFQARVATTLFILAGLSDFFDGYLARKFKVESRFGAMMDPIADKLLSASVLLCLVFLHRADMLPVLIIIMREILVSGLREYLAASGGKMPVTKLAKWKTTAQFVAITFLLAAPAFSISHEEIHAIGIISLWIAGLLTLITGVQYSVKTTKIVKELPPQNVKLLTAPKKKKENDEAQLQLPLAPSRKKIPSRKKKSS